MSDTTAATEQTTTAQTPAPAATAAESLLQVPAATAKADEPTPAAGAQPSPSADDMGWLPEKYRVMGADGQLDLNASAKKLGEGYGALATKLGQGSPVPANPAEYAFDVPEQFKDMAMDETATAAFKERAHKAGLTPEQYKWVMEEYFTLVPDVVQGAVTKSAAQAQEKLQQVWSNPEDYSRNIQQAQRALSLLPQGMGQEAVDAGLGINPTFIKIMASLGKEMGEDRSPVPQGAPAGGTNVDDLMASEAYRNPRHPQHEQVSQQVAAFFKAQTKGA